MNVLFTPNCVSENSFCQLPHKRRKTKRKMTLGDIKTCLQSSDHSNWVKLDGRLKTSLTPQQQTFANTLGFGTNIPDASGAVLMQSGSLGNVSGSNSRMLTRGDLPDFNLNATVSSDGGHTHGTGSAGGHTHSAQAAGGHSHTVNGVGDHQHLVDGEHLGSGSGGELGYYGANGTKSGAVARWSGWRGAHTHSLQGVGDHTHTVSTVSDHSHTIDAVAAHNHTTTIESLNGGVAQQSLDVTPKNLSVNMFVWLST